MRFFLTFELLERRYFGELVNLLDIQVQEMKSMSTAIRKLEGDDHLLCNQSIFFGQFVIIVLEQ